jgi:hypothetical protein
MSLPSVRAANMFVSSFHRKLFIIVPAKQDHQNICHIKKLSVLTQLYSFAIFAKNSDLRQVKISVFIDDCHPPLSCRPTLVQIDLHHLQLQQNIIRCSKRIGIDHTVCVNGFPSPRGLPEAASNMWTTIEKKIGCRTHKGYTHLSHLLCPGWRLCRHSEK